ncbi:MAG: hypothetical protein ACRELY_19170 [Polyangiaceae bacterium]
MKREDLIINLLVDRDPPASFEALEKLGMQAFRFVNAVCRDARIGVALFPYGYTKQTHEEGLAALRDAMMHANASEEAKRALHAWLSAQHLRALQAGMKRSQLIALGVVERRARAVPEESGIVLKRGRIVT